MSSVEQLGNQLQVARKQRGLSREAVADALGLSCEYVASLERGQQGVSAPKIGGVPEIIAKLAEIYQCSPMFFFSANKTFGKDDLPAVVHRELSDLDLGLEIKVELWRLFRLFGDGMGLRKILGQTVELKLPDYDPQRVNLPDPELQGEEAARQERLRLGLQNRPIGKAARLIGRHGIWTVATGLPKGLSGLLVNHPHVGLAILVNREHRYRHRRFFYSRAFAHALFDRSGRTVVTMRETGLSDRQDIRANAFAAEFLMPREGVAKQLARISARNQNSRVHMGIHPADGTRVDKNIHRRATPRAVTCLDAVDLADHFGVSYEMAIVRLENLGHISPKQKRALAKENGLACASANGPYSPLKSPARAKTGERELRGQLIRLAQQAFKKEKISRGRLMEFGKELEIQYHELFENAKSTSSD